MEEQGVKEPSAKKQRMFVEEDTDAKRELARRLMEGNGFPQNHQKAVALLEDCVALGDAEAMIMLAKCCALGHGMERDAERAESLISEAANEGNDEALCIIEIFDEWKGQQSIDMSGLYKHFWKNVSSETLFCF